MRLAATLDTSSMGTQELRRDGEKTWGSREDVSQEARMLRCGQSPKQKELFFPQKGGETLQECLRRSAATGSSRVRPTVRRKGRSKGPCKSGLCQL